MRALSKPFIHDLKDGFLHPILKRVQQDHTLMLAIRDGYINIYYRGGNLLKIKELSKNSYLSSFNNQYNEPGNASPDLPASIKSQNDVKIWIDAFPHLKQIMDIYFSMHNKPEREFQQLVARENNYSTISNESEYFVSDIEFSESSLKARFDILAIRWLASDRKNGSNCRPVLIEMKYGDGALGGETGLLKHLQDIDKLISTKGTYEPLLEMMDSQINLLIKLELLKFNYSSGTEVKLDHNDKPEVIFLLANHNPRSTKLSSILDDKDVLAYGQSQCFDLRFFVSSFAGYGLHSDCMLTLAQFRDLLENPKAKQNAAVDGDSAVSQ